MKTYYFKFNYDRRGFGDLELHNDSLTAMSIVCRTGSINKDGMLVNAIAESVWRIMEPPVDTDEYGMHIHPGEGWKVRLFREDGSWTSFLMHPDGGKPGSLGCIVFQGTDARDLKQRIEEIMKKQKEILVYVNCEPPEVVC